MSQQTDPDFERQLVAAVAPYVGRRIDDIGREMGVTPSGGKGHAAKVARTLLFGLVPGGEASFERRELEIKTVRKPPRGRPYEAMSFPAFDANELVRETWEQSTLSKLLRRLVLVPLLALTKTVPLSASTLGEVVFWSPDERQATVIKSEWEMFRSLIGGGASLRLPSAASTHAIHVRTHAQNARDRGFAPGVGHIPKRSFWLNQDFVRSIIE